MRKNRSSIASRRNRRRMRARLRDLAIHGTSDLQAVPRIAKSTVRDSEILLTRCAVAWSRVTGQAQWVVRDRLANHAPKIVPASCRKGGTYGVGIDGSTDNPTRHGHKRVIRVGKAYKRRNRGHFRLVPGDGATMRKIYDCDCGCKMTQQIRDLHDGMRELLPIVPKKGME